MSFSVDRFHTFDRSIADSELPECFTWPFCYQPHPLARQAAEEVQQHLATQAGWQHNFANDGKMFGVLVVRHRDGEVGYLAAFAGELAGSYRQPGFVPSVAEPAHDSCSQTGQLAALAEQIKQREVDPALAQRENRLNTLLADELREVDAQRKLMTENRKARKAQRKTAEQLTDAVQQGELMEQLAQASVIEKLQLRDLKLQWEKQIAEASDALAELKRPLQALRDQHDQLAAQIQKEDWDRYRFLNATGDQASLSSLFSQTPRQNPPEGAGDCVAPKLLQYAFSQGFTPVAMAEFWWGRSPQSEVRHHGRFYPVSQGRCKPILNHMLAGMKVDADPLLVNPAEGKTLDVLYQDEHMLVLNKPSGFLSVPGKSIQDSVGWRMEQMFPHAKGHLIVHRLDMATSGLMVIALSKKAHKRLQQQFIDHNVEKRYEALLSGELLAEQGTINLPLRGDYDDLPRQLVCHQYGKPAETFWQTCGVEAGRTRVYLYPKTGRTHQLRMHCAHNDGLATPIVGDELYGFSEGRLHLHAGLLKLNHPISGEPMCFEAEAEF